jgi:hypothetical protein
MSAFSNLGGGLPGDVKSRAGWGIFLGILTALLGLLLIAYPLFAATVTTIFIASILVVAGVLEVVQALRVHTVGAFFARLRCGDPRVSDSCSLARELHLGDWDSSWCGSTYTWSHAHRPWHRTAPRHWKSRRNTHSPPARSIAARAILVATSKG